MAPEVRDRIRKILKAPYSGAGAAEQQVDSLLNELSVALPEDYLDFLRLTNGYTGEVGDNGFVSIWPIEEVVPTNKANHVWEWAPGLVLFGSNEGSEYYAFDMRNDRLKVVMVPAVPLDIRFAVENGGSFVEFLEKLAQGRHGAGKENESMPLS